MKDIKNIKNYYHSDCWGILFGKNISTSRVGSMSAGQIIELYLAWSEDKVFEAKARVYGGPYLINAAGFLCEWIIGKEKKDFPEFTAQKILNIFEFPEFKKSAAFLVEDVLRGIP